MTKRRRNAKSPALFKKTAERRWSKPYREMIEDSLSVRKCMQNLKQCRSAKPMSPASIERIERRLKAMYKKKREEPQPPLSQEDDYFVSPAEYKRYIEGHIEMREAISCRGSSIEMRECSSGNCSSVDRISMLPDELLSIILSRVTFKEQFATSILSRRWRYLWTLSTKLDFDGVISLISVSTRMWPGQPSKHERLAREKCTMDFVSWVNQVVASRKVSTIEDFRVYFDLGKKDEGFINEWLRYALACKVERLDLNLNATRAKHHRGVYVIPDGFFSRIHDEEVGCNPNPYPNPKPIHFKQLKTISLSHVGVDGKALEFFLHNCPLLEDLSVFKSSVLSSLRVTGPFPSLKRLEISRCCKLESLEICDVINLVCFKYSGQEKIRFLLRNLPMLVHLCVSDLIFEYMKVNVAQFSSILERLEIFNIHPESLSVPSILLPPEMSNLKQLEVVVWSNLVNRDESLLWLADLIFSAPHLQKFVLESHRKDPRHSLREIQRKKVEKSYDCLQEVEFVGFCGVPSDFEFVYHFLDNAPVLKKFVINTKKTHANFQRINGYVNYYVDRGWRKQLKKQLALEKPWIKLDFITAPTSMF